MKKINIATTNKKTLGTLSIFNQSYLATIDIRAKYAPMLKEATDAVKAIVTKREEAAKTGMSITAIERTYPLLAADNKVRALENARDAELAPHKENIKLCVKDLPDELYTGLVYAIAKQNESAVPGKNTTVTIGKSEYVVTKSYMSTLKDIACAWGFGNTENAQSLTRFAKAIILLMPATQKDNKNGNYIVAKSKSQVGEAFFLAVIAYGIQSGSWAVDDDRNIILRQYND